MKSIDILIPMADGHRLSTLTLYGISIQDITLSIIPLTRPNGGHELEASNRNLLKQYAEGDYVCMMDSDVVLLNPTDASDCLTYLKTHPDVDAVALDTKVIDVKKQEQQRHVCIAFMCIRVSTLKSIIFSTDGIDDKTKPCNCESVNMACKIKYLDDRKLTEDKRSTHVRSIKRKTALAN
jgi:hypothetical protein